MDERIKFIARILDGEKMTVLCREFNISRKTGYKIVKRYNDSGLEALTDHSRRPYRHANQLPMQIEKLIVRLKKDKINWGAPKIRMRDLITTRRGVRGQGLPTQTGGTTWKYCWTIGEDVKHLQLGKGSATIRLLVVLQFVAQKDDQLN